MRRFDAPDKTEGVFHCQPGAEAAIILLRYTRHFRDGGQTRTSSLGAARPLPPSADIGPGGQSVGQAAQFCLGEHCALWLRRRSFMLPCLIRSPSQPASDSASANIAKTRIYFLPFALNHFSGSPIA